MLWPGLWVMLDESESLECLLSFKRHPKFQADCFEPVLLATEGRIRLDYCGINVVFSSRNRLTTAISYSLVGLRGLCDSAETAFLPTRLETRTKESITYMRVCG